MMSKYAGWALALSIILHLASVLAEPVANWLSFRQIDDPVLKKTDRNLAAQALDDLDTPAELVGVKPVEQQYVLLQQVPVSAQPATTVRPTASPEAMCAVEARKRASQKQ